MRSLWANDSDTDTAVKSYESIGREIEKNHGQFDIIDDDLILNCNDEKLKNGIIAMGNAEYTTIYIPADKYMPCEVKSRLEVFANSGGRICRKGNTVFFPELDISGDNGTLRVHKRQYDKGYIYLVFNESPDKINATITLPDDAKEIDAINKKIYTAYKNYTFESGEIKIFITGCNALAEERPYNRGNKICHIEKFKIRRIKKFSLDHNGISYKDAEDTEQETTSGDWSVLYGEDFSGKCQYRANFTLDSELRDLILSLGKVCYNCEVGINGKKAADLFMPPYETVIDKALLKKENELVITVSGSASNAFVHFQPPAEWEEKHIGPYHQMALKFEKELLSGGLLTDIEIFETDKEN